MNDDPIEDAATYEARARRARQGLADSLRDMTNVGGKVLRRTGRVGLGALIGLAFLGTVALVVRSRRRRLPRNVLQRYLKKEPSFIGQAVRSVVLSMLSVLASRIARRLPLPAPREPAE